jgi:hypothetical protein
MSRIPYCLAAMVFASALALTAPGQEPVKPKLTPKIITATRQVALFTGLEKILLEAVQKKDRSAIEGMLADDFEIGMPDADPLAGEDWLDSVISGDFRLKTFGIRQMTVADLGDTAVVKFDRLQQASYKGKDETGEFFVVDVWKKSAGSWKLANRYVAKVSSVVPPPPKPTGKD